MAKKRKSGPRPKRPAQRQAGNSTGPSASRTSEPRPSEPRPSEPRSSEPRPSEPRSSEPRSSEPRSSEPRSSEPRSSGSRSAEFRPSEPRPSDSRPSESRSSGSRTPAADRRAASSAPTAARAAATSPEPAFWFGFEVSWAKLAVGRALLFGILAIDALLQIRHAPRYGAGGFNVAQIPWLDALGPTRWSYDVAQLINAYLLTLAACGIATRIALPIVATLYAWLYFGSQLDSYQHHYLVSLVLLVACFIPWQRPADAGPRTRVRSWALRVLLAQLAIMYFWAAVSKMNGAWLDGSALSRQLSGPVVHLITWKLPILHVAVGMAIASKLVLATELTLAATICFPRAWPAAAPLGIMLHLGILLSSLDIGLFAWIMLALYAFVVPDRVWERLAELAPIRAVRSFASAARARLAGGLAWMIGGLGGVTAITVAGRCRFPHALGVMAVVIAIGGALCAAAVLLGRRPRIAQLGLASVAAIGLWVSVDRGSTVIVDYYRFWGGASRRLGDLHTAEDAYRTLTEVAPGDANGHFQLARLLLERDDGDDALAQLHTAEALDPHRARAFLLEVQWLAEHGRRAEAIAKAEAAVAAEPHDRAAHEVLQQLRRRP